MKKHLFLTCLMLLTLVLLLSLTACGAKNTPVDSSAAPDQGEPVSTGSAEAETRNAPETTLPADTEPAPETPASEEAVTDPPAAEKDTLVVYFSATGTTKAVAEKLAALTDADLYEIQAAQPYTADDLDWHDSSSRTTREQNDPDVRPEIGSETVSLAGYSTIYIGFPIWWGEEPRILDTFVEAYNFDGITMIPFCTSSSSGLGRSGQNLEENAGSGTWLEGKRFGAGASEDELRDWIEGLR